MTDLCLWCGNPAKLWSQKKDQDKRFWCSHTCKLLIDEGPPKDDQLIPSDDSREVI